jgi:CRISPR-associated endonuclease/helicase Cas3
MKTIAKAEPRYNPKYFQTLKGHTTDSLKILKAYMENHGDVIGQFCMRWGLDKEAFLRSLFTTVYLHDIGKLTKEFQENIQNGKSSQRYPHAFFALFILNQIDFPALLDVPIEKAAILGHHTQLHSQLYACDEDFNKPSLLENDIKEFVRSAREIYLEIGFDKWFSFDSLGIRQLPVSRNISSILRDYRNELVTTISSFENKEKIKSIFCYLFSILETCDDYSSAEFSDFIKGYDDAETIFDSIINDPNKYVLRLLVNDPYKKILCENKPYEYQEDGPKQLCHEVPFYSLLFAPCGRGKTEAALLWALKTMKKYKRNKIVFAMPTQITSNAMWERFCKIFGEGKNKKEKIKYGQEYVGLFHGKSFVKLRATEAEEKGDLEEIDVAEVRSENFKGNVFSKPVTVTTIDHLIYSFIHGFSQADFALGNLQNAVIVFDEVHYYAKETLEHLVTLFELLKKMRIPHLLMSGTLPEFFIKRVKDVNDEYEGPFQDTDGLHFEPFKIELSDENLAANGRIKKEVIKEIIEGYRDKRLVQYIILNTVERSKFVYEVLKKRLKEFDKNPNIILHHSQFTYRDREEKEKNILNFNEKKLRPFILVATQVIEVSLDISCDVMYTELAPGDALGQRGGRLNRKGHTWASNGAEHVMKIFMPEEEKPYDPALILNTKNAIINGPYSYLRLKNVCDKVYSNYQLTTPTALKNVFRECSLFGYSPHEITFGDEDRGRLVQIRDEEVQKFDVIPWEYYNGDENNLIVENQVKVPIWWYKQDEKKHGEARYFERVTKNVGRKEKYYWATRIPYNKETGFDVKALSSCLPLPSAII